LPGGIDDRRKNKELNDGNDVNDGNDGKIMM